MNIQEIHKKITDSIFEEDGQLYIHNQILMAVILEIFHNELLKKHIQDLLENDPFLMIMHRLNELARTILLYPQSNTLFMNGASEDLYTALELIDFFQNVLIEPDNNSIVAQADLVHNNNNADDIVHNNDTEATSWTDFLNPFFCCTTVANVINPAYIVDNGNNQNHFVGGSSSSGSSQDI